MVINNAVLTVNAAPLSVAAANATRLYGAANPAFTGTITGLKNGDNITASYTTVADPTSNVGSYAITPLLSDPTNKLSNYAVTSDQRLTDHYSCAADGHRQQREPCLWRSQPGIHRHDHWTAERR